MPGTPPTTPRLGVARFATGDPDQVPIDLNTVVDRLDIVAGRFESGVLASRPNTGAGIADRYYFATDDTSGGPSGTLYRDAGGATPTWQRINPANAEAAFSTDKHIITATGNFNAAGAGTYMLAQSGGGGAFISGGAGTAPAMFYLSPSLYLAGSRTTKLAILATVVTNAVAPGVSFTVNLNSVTGGTGASGVSVGVAVGAGVSGIGVSINTPAAANITASQGPDATAPAAGPYVLSVVVSGAMAAGSTVSVIAQLLMRQV